MKFLSTHKGYALVFAVIVSGIVLAIAAFILAVSRKQFILSSISRDSTLAIFAADSGLECAEHTYTTSGAGHASPGGTFTISCNNQSYPTTFGQPGSAGNFNVPSVFDSTSVIMTSTALIPLGKTCARVVIYEGNDASDGSHVTVIDARGYNQYDSTQSPLCPLPGPRDTERAIQITYHD